MPLVSGLRQFQHNHLAGGKGHGGTGDLPAGIGQKGLLHGSGQMQMLLLPAEIRRHQHSLIVLFPVIGQNPVGIFKSRTEFAVGEQLPVFRGFPQRRQAAVVIQHGIRVVLLRPR